MGYLLVEGREMVKGEEYRIATEHGGDALVAEWRNGWPVVLSGFAGNGLGFSMFLMTAGIFIVPIQQELGLTRVGASIGPMVGLVVAFLTPLAAILVDRHGARACAIAGLTILAMGYFMLATLPASRITYFTIAAIVALAGTVSSPMVYCRGVATWFSRHAGLAFGITMSGTSIVAAIMSPLLSAVLRDLGWREGYALCGVVVALVGLPLVLGLFRDKRRIEISPVVSGRNSVWRQAAREAIGTPQFWLLILSFTFAALAIGGIMSQLYPIMIQQGYSAQMAALTVSVYAVSMGSGRVIAGLLLDRMQPVLVAAACLCLAALGAVLLYVALFGGGHWYFAFFAAFLLGWGQGAEGDFLAFFTQKLFGMDAFAFIFSWFNLVVGSGLGIGGLIFAGAYDHFGNYQVAIAANGALWLISAGFMLALWSGYHRQSAR